jgi:GxxExxY protein
MAEADLRHHELTRSVIGCFYEVYNTLGVGFLEALYSLALERELRGAGHRVSREHAVRVYYKGEELGFQRLDLVVDETLVVEIKSTQVLHSVAFRQLQSYLRGSNLEVGLLLHFGPEPKVQRASSANRRTRS